MPSHRTKGQLEAEISQAAVKFERAYMGRGPTDIKTYLLHDLVIIRLFGILTPAEKQLVKAEGVELLKQIRAKLLEHGRHLLKKSVEEIVGLPVTSLHSDLSTVTGERIIVFVLSSHVEKQFLDKKKPS